jgi:hypothetical protein
MTSLFQRLRERKLFQWALPYLAGAWIVFQGVEVMAEHSDPRWDEVPRRAGF